MDLATLLLSQGQPPPTKTLAGHDPAQGIRTSSGKVDDSALTAFDDILRSLEIAERNAAHSTRNDTRNGQDTALLANDNASQDLQAKLALLTGTAGQNFPSGSLETLNTFLNAQGIEVAPEQLESLLAGDGFSALREAGIDIAALSEAVQKAVSAPEAPLSSRLGILNTVLVGDTDADQTVNGDGIVQISRDDLQTLSLDLSQRDLTRADLTPQQIAVLQDYVSSFGHASGVPVRETLTPQQIQSLDELDALLNTFLANAPPQTQTLPPALQTLLNTHTGTVKVTPPGGDQNAAALARELNALTPGDGGESVDLSQPAAKSAMAKPEDLSNFEMLLKQMRGESSGREMPTLRGDNAAVKDAPLPRQNTVMPVNAGMQQAAALPEGFVPGDTLAGGTSGSGHADFSETLTAMLNSTSSQLSTGQTALLAQANSATQSHPATQMVAATLQRAAQGNGNTQITLQLDPAELGKVEVKMTIDQDNMMKAVITAEKPETHMMMQRDSQTLEKALQAVGLDSSSDSLSFELAQDGSFFDNDNRQGGGNGGGHSGNGGHGGDSDIGDDGIIESTMTWDIDPETGHMHYSILV